MGHHAGGHPHIRGRDERADEFDNEITLGKRQGMISLEDSLAKLVRQGLISLEDAKIRSARPDELESQLRSQTTA